MTVMFLTPDECASIVAAFDRVDGKVDEALTEPDVYFNSRGIGNLPATLAYVDRFTEKFRGKYPGLKFSNTYTREYRRGSMLAMHTDREALDLTLSICLEDRNNLEWPLNVSVKTHDGPWDKSADTTPYMQDYLAVNLPLGHGVVVEGKKHPHWRDKLLCGENQRAVYVFYHWTFESVEEDTYDVLMHVAHPEVQLCGNFLSDEECAALISGAEHRLVPSNVVDQQTGESVSHVNRTSSGTHYGRGESPMVQAIEARISRLTGIPVENGEGIQILRYEVGQEYKPHFDYFPLDQGGTPEHVKNGGQRIATVIMYLNTPEEGGQTIFPDAAIAVKAQKGNALLFKYNKPDKSTLTLHGGLPVKQGVKWIATKWLREHKHG